MKKGLILGMACLTLLCGCGKIPKLKNGEEVAISFKKGDKTHEISVDEMFTVLKNNFGFQTTLKLINTYIYETEFKDYLDEAKKTAKSYIDAMIEGYGGEDKLLSLIQNQTGMNSIEAYQEYLYQTLLENHAVTEYAKTLVKDKEIEAYYKDNIKGDIEVYHILVTPKVTDKMTDEEKTKAEEKAKTTANDIIKRLNESKNKLETFKKLVKDYSEDEATKKKDGNLGFINYGDLSGNYDKLLDSAYKLKDGEYSKKIITTELGYHVIYRNATKEKDKLKDVKNDIIKTLAEEKVNSITTISVDSMKYYHKLYNLNIVDSDINRQYGIYLNNLINKNTKSEK
jgi:Ni,Fe-hydrogenase maturation factor